MAQVFGFNDDELKLLLVAVRHMRRTFAHAGLAGAEAPAMGTYAAMYDALFEKLREMAGPLPESAETILE